MKKGLAFLVLLALLFWGYQYLVKTAPEKSKKRESLRKPFDNAQDAVHEANRNILEMSIEIFKQKEGRYPANLNELVEKGYIDKIPDPGSRPWEYDPGTGGIK